MKRYVRYLPGLAGVVGVASITAVAVYALFSFIEQPEDAPRKVVQNITLITPPPPPPPPPEVEKPPEPEIEEEVELDEPEEAPPEDVTEAVDDMPPLGDDLGLDADGGAGGDLFGLLGKRGGRDIIGGGGGLQFRWYTNIVQQEIADKLSEYEDIRKDRYSVEVYLWIASDGAVERVKLARATGNDELNQKIKVALADLDRIGQEPPGDLPQPVILRLSSRL